MNTLRICLIAMMNTLALTVFSQSRKAEANQMSRSYQLGGLTQSEYRELGVKWNALLSEIGGYNDLPFNKETGITQFEFIKSFKGLGKEVIYERVKKNGQQTIWGI